MAEVYNHALPPTPPAPVYSPGPGRTSSPQIIAQHYDIQNANSSAFAQNNIAVSSRPAISMVPPEYGRDMGAAASVQLYSPETSSSQYQSTLPPIRTQYASQHTQHQDTSRLSPQILPRRKPLDDTNRNVSDTSHRRIVSENTLQPATNELEAKKRSVRHVSASFASPDQQEENYEPLRYHHLGTEDDHLNALNKRASKLTHWHSG